jgi:hypothetical protein
MAKKNPSPRTPAPARASRKQSDKPVAPADVAGSTTPAPIAEASDRAVPQEPTVSDTPAEPQMAASASTTSEPAGTGPTYDDIARAAYEKYLSRGGDHGRDFDDWLEAEQALRSRK